MGGESETEYRERVRKRNIDRGEKEEDLKHFYFLERERRKTKDFYFGLLFFLSSFSLQAVE